MCTNAHMADIVDSDFKKMKKIYICFCFAITYFKIQNKKQPKKNIMEKEILYKSTYIYVKFNE